MRALGWLSKFDTVPMYLPISCTAVSHLLFILSVLERGNFTFVLNHSLDAAHSLDSVWARPTHSINCRVNGIEAHSLDKLSSQWAGPYTRHFIEWMGHRPVRSTGYWVSGTNAQSPLHRVSGPVSHSKDERIRSEELRWGWFV